MYHIVILKIKERNTSNGVFFWSFFKKHVEKMALFLSKTHYFKHKIRVKIITN